MLNLSEGSMSRGRFNPRSNYDKEFIAEVVNAVEEGQGSMEVCRHYGLPKSTLATWMRNYGSVAYQQGRKLPVPIELKRTIVRAIEEGRMTVREAKIAYKIKAEGTIRRWRRELKQENAELAASTHHMTDRKAANNRPGTDTTPAEIKALQEALRDAELKVAALNTLIDVAEEQLKINIRKKPGAKQ